MRREYILVAGLWLVTGCTSMTTQPQPACFHRNVAVETDIGYCQAVRKGNTLYVSGVPGQGDMPSAVRSVYERLKLILKDNGLSFANVVKENVYAIDLDAFIQSKDIRKAFYGGSFPTSTWVQVQRLYLPAFVVEIELTAEFPK